MFRIQTSIGNSSSLKKIPGGNSRVLWEKIRMLLGRYVHYDVQCLPCGLSTQTSVNCIIILMYRIQILILKSDLALTLKSI